MIVADTDVLIDYLSGRGPVADRISVELERGRLATTVITRFELLSGAKGARQERSIRDLLDGLTTLILDRDAADVAATVRRRLQELGSGIGMGDSLIAGIVLLHDGILLTRNCRHFERVEGLHLGAF